MRRSGAGRQQSPTLIEAREADKIKLAQSVLLATSQKTTQHAAFALLFCVATDAISLMCVTPNFPLMVTPGAHPDSFPKFGLSISTAQYLLICVGGLATVLSNFFFSWLGDRYNSRLAILILMAGTVITTIAKYFAKPSYWYFVLMTVVTSLFGGTIGAANGYMAKLFHQDQHKVDLYVTYNMAAMVVFRSLGGLLTVVFADYLFLPLVPSAALSLLAFGLAYRFVLDPGKINESCFRGDSSDKPPEKIHTIHTPTMVNIVIGSLSDCIGSNGLTAFAFAPVLWKTWYLDFVEEEQNPIMSENEYRLLYALLGIAAVPGVIASVSLFQKFGIPLVCVIANLLTGIIIIVIIVIAQFDPTKGTYIAYICVIYVSFPLTVISNFTTGPMLDRITPFEKKGFIQGVNAGIFEASNAVASLALGILSDRNMFAGMWVCVGFSFFAVFANIPLICNPRLRDRNGNDDDSDEAITLTDDEELQKRLNNVEYVPLRNIYEANLIRAKKGEPLLRSRFGTYSRSDLYKYKELGEEDLKYLKEVLERRLNALSNAPEEEKLRYVETLSATSPNEDEVVEAKKEMGEWACDYFEDNGYFLGTGNPQILKGIFMKFFPRINDGPQLSVEGVEEHLITLTRLINDQIELENLHKNKISKMVSKSVMSRRSSVF